MSQDEHFQFVKAIAMDLNRDDVKLPSFPDVVVRIRSALNSPDTTAEQVADILGVDAVLASRILVLANSSYYNPAGVKIQSLGPAVGRIGFEKVRSAAITYAIEQLHLSKEFDAVKADLRELWSAGLRLGAMSEVIARECTKFDSDGAFIAGLLHRIGTLYIFSKYKEYPALIGDAESRQHIIDEWSAPIGESIVANWKFPKEIRATLNPDEGEEPAPGDGASLCDVVIVAKDSIADNALQPLDTPSYRRLAITEDQVSLINDAYHERLTSLASSVR